MAKLDMVSVVLEGEHIILGETEIGRGTRIGAFCILGYPSRKKWDGLTERGALDCEALDSLSSGARIGEDSVIRSFTTIYEDTALGKGVSTGHNVLIREGTIVGDSSLIGSGTIIDGRVNIGSRVSVQSGVYIPPLTEIGNGCFLGPRVIITNDKYPPSSKMIGVKVGDGAIIGAGATLVAGVRIGDGAVVGSGAVVTKNVEEDTVVIGVPAKPAGTRGEYERKKRQYEKEL